VLDFGRKPADLRVPRRRWNLLAGREPAQLAVRKRLHASRREARQDRRRQRIDGKGLCEKTHPPVPAHARQRQLLRDCRRLLVLPDDTGWQEVAILPAIRCDPDLEEHEVPGAPTHHIAARDPDRADLAVLGRKPTPSREIGDENLLFDDAFWLGRQQLSDLVPHHQRHKFGQRLGGRHAPGGHRRILRQAEPVEGMLRQGQQIADLPDWREHRAAQQIDRHPSSKLRKIKLHRLRGAREVGDAENRLLPTLRFEFPEKSKNLSVSGIQQADSPTSEGAVALPDRKHPPRPVQK